MLFQISGILLQPSLRTKGRRILEYVRIGVMNMDTAGYDCLEIDTY